MLVFVNSERGGPADTLDYEIQLADNNYCLYRIGKDFYEKGLAASLEDTGNEVIVNLKDRSFVLDYEEVVIVLSLLMASYEGKLELKEAQTIKSI